jgi:hypothetical protein
MSSSSYPGVIQDQMAESRQQAGRPVPDAMAEVQAAAAKVNGLIDGWRATGEILLKIDVLQWPGVLTIHVPLPKGE